MRSPLETYDNALRTMTYDELIEFTAKLLAALDELHIEVDTDDIERYSETGE